MHDQRGIEAWRGEGLLKSRARVGVGLVRGFSVVQEPVRLNFFGFPWSGQNRLEDRANI